MPQQEEKGGECLRCEGHYSTKEKKKVADIVGNIVGADGDGESVGKKHPFTTAEEMLLNTKAKNEMDNSEGEGEGEGGEEV